MYFPRTIRTEPPPSAMTSAQSSGQTTAEEDSSDDTESRAYALVDLSSGRSHVLHRPWHLRDHHESRVGPLLRCCRHPARHRVLADAIHRRPGHCDRVRGAPSTDARCAGVHDRVGPLDSRTASTEWGLRLRAARASWELRHSIGVPALSWTGAFGAGLVCSSRHRSSDARTRAT